MISALVLAMTVAYAGGVLAEPSSPTSSQQLGSAEKDAVKPAVVKPPKSTSKMKKSTKEKKTETPKPAGK